MREHPLMRHDFETHLRMLATEIRLFDGLPYEFRVLLCKRAMILAIAIVC